VKGLTAALLAGPVWLGHRYAKMITIGNIRLKVPYRKRLRLTL
jgi:hypothetical protein